MYNYPFRAIYEIVISTTDLIDNQPQPKPCFNYKGLLKSFHRLLVLEYSKGAFNIEILQLCSVFIEVYEKRGKVVTYIDGSRSVPVLI